MSFEHRSCVLILCDNGCDDPFDEGEPHFTSEQAAADYARRNGWLVADDRTLCRECALKADCSATAHQWSKWSDTALRGVAYRTRWCEHCGGEEYDPPRDQLLPVLLAIDDAERIVADALNGDQP